METGENRECTFNGMSECTHPYSKCSECEVIDQIDDSDLVEADLVDPDCKRRMDRNNHWSDEFKRGYAQGYQSAKAHWKGRMEKALIEKEREPKELTGMFPLNVIYDILEESESDADVIMSVELITAEMRRRLTEREYRVLEMRYAWNLTLEETGKRFNVTRERIRQVEAKALRKLKHPTSMERMRCVSRSEYVNMVNRVHDLEFENQQMRNMLDIKQEEHVEEINTNIMNTPIEELDLSVRSYNCLRRAGITTVSDLAELAADGESLEHVRNMGVKSAREVRSKLNELGVNIA